MGVGKPQVERREFLSAAGVALAAAALPGDGSPSKERGVSPVRAEQEALSDVAALTFDVFGTVVDWRTSIIREGGLLSLEKEAADLLGLPPARVTMVAAHRGDLAAAKAVGFKTAFVPRPLEYGPDQEVDTTPDSRFDITATDFLDLAVRI